MIHIMAVCPTVRANRGILIFSIKSDGMRKNIKSHVGIALSLLLSCSMIGTTVSAEKIYIEGYTDSVYIPVIAEVAISSENQKYIDLLKKDNIDLNYNIAAFATV